MIPMHGFTIIIMQPLLLFSRALTRLIAFVVLVQLWITLIYQVHTGHLQDSMSTENNPVHGLISGASAGVVASIICAPLDIAKVR